MPTRPFIPVPKVIETEVTFRLGDLYMSNRFFFQREFFDWPPSAEVIVAGDVGTWAINRYLPCIASDVSLVHVRGRDIQTSEGPWVTIPYTGYAGSWPDVAMSANVCNQVRLRNSEPTQRQKPCVFVPAPPRNAIVENTFTDAYLSAVIDAFSYLFGAVSIGGVDWAWVSFRLNNAWRSEGLVRRVGLVLPNPTVSPRRRRLRNLELYP